MNRAQRFFKYVLYTIVCFLTFGLSANALILDGGSPITINNSKVLEYGKIWSLYDYITLEEKNVNQYIFGNDYEYTTSCEVVSGKSEYITFISSPSVESTADYHYSQRFYNQNTSNNVQLVTVKCLTSAKKFILTKEMDTKIFRLTLKPREVIEKTVSYSMFPGDSVNLMSSLKIRNITNNSVFSSLPSSYSVAGCDFYEDFCEITYEGTDVTHNRVDTFVIEYTDVSDKAYKVTVRLIQKDPDYIARAYPGLMGTCDFDDKWENAQWSDSSGRRYYFHETNKTNATLPDCSETAQNGVLYDFKGWSRGYEAGDVLSTTSTCQNLVAVGSTIELGERYAPCYELVPHVRLFSNGGTIKQDGTWSFNPSDMSYIAEGVSINSYVVLPDVQYVGYHSSSSLSFWENKATGVRKNAGESVKLDGSVWTAVSDNKTTRVDLYKIVGLNKVEVFSVEGMTNCSLKTDTSTFVLVEYKNGDCKVTGKQLTSPGQYGVVDVTLEDGSERTYNFSVEDRTGVDQAGNGIFIVDTSQNIVIGENDAELTDNLYTDQCNAFTVSSTNYGATKVGFANSKKTGEVIYSGAYHVVNKCPTDNNNYIAFCLDPGRKGPGEMSDNKADYIKASDINIETDFGKLIAYIVKNFHVTSFGDYANQTNAVKTERVASHVALRISAIKNGLSTAVDSADLVFSSHYYPYEAVAQKLAELDNDGDISLSDAKNALDYKTSKGNGFNWGGYETYYNKIAEILSAYDGSSGASVTNDGFERTIDKTDVQTIGTTGYSITYEGAITVPTGTDSADLKTCNLANATAAGISCEVNYFEDSEKVAEGNRKIYNYKVTIKATNASSVKVPVGEAAEKALSFVFEYQGAALVQSAFVANPASGSDSLQRMLILTTSIPKVYIYFNIVPRDCDLPFLNKDNCKDKDSCSINTGLFVAAGCCRYLINTTTYQYLVNNFCEPTCTTSTLSSACSYTLTGKGKSDVYTIKEGERYNSYNTWEPNVGSCVANVSDYYVNDNASVVEFLPDRDEDGKGDGHDFIYKDDADNLRNIDAYKDNRYCQVTCKEDWEISMDSFGNFVGENAVAAGTYFQIVSSDVFIQGTRTCYSSFINYDRFMANVVDLSSKVVENYNKYSEWSHTWTDLDRQDSDETAHQISGSVNESAAVCVEYFDKCPDNYYWSDIGGTCRQVPDFNKGTSGASETNCTTKPSTYSKDDDSDDYHDGTIKYSKPSDISSFNSDNTMCTFTRTYCPGNDEPFGTQSLSTDNKKCNYWDYEKRTTTAWSYSARDTEDWDYSRIATKSRTYEYQVRSLTSRYKKRSTKTRTSSNPTRNGTCTGNGVLIGDKCYSTCPSGYDTIDYTTDTLCYETCSGDYSVESSIHSGYCWASTCPSGTQDDGSGDCRSTTCPSGFDSFTGDETYSGSTYNGKKYCRKRYCSSGYTWNGSTCVSTSCPSGYDSYSGTLDGKDGALYCRKCPSGYSNVNGTCVSTTCLSGYDSYSGTKDSKDGALYCRKCPTGYSDVDGTCVNDSCPTGYDGYTGEGDKLYCRVWTNESSLNANLSMLPIYNTDRLRCKVYGKSYSYTLNTANNVSVGNSVDGKDIFYGTTQSSAVAMAGSGGGLSDTYTQNTVWNNGAVSYAKSYTHKCEITPAVYYPSAIGSSSCSGTTSSGDNLYSGYTKSNSMFCTEYADLTGNDKDKAFCKVNGIHENHNSNASTSNFNTSYKDLTDAFDYMVDNMKDQAKSKAHYYRSQMSSYNSTIYSHAYDLFDCQHFQLHNNTDDRYSSRANNTIENGAVLGVGRSYVKISTEFNPTAAYTYDEKQFMTILGKDNVLEQFTEKNDNIFGGDKKYAQSTNEFKEVSITLPNGQPYKTKLYRNYLTNSYYNPGEPWEVNSDEYKEYKDGTEKTSLTGMQTESKKIVLCSVGTKTYDAGSYDGREGAVESFSITGSNPEWLGGHCWDYNVYYKKIHYVKSSISNSSFYKNKGYWYISSSDIKEHGDDFASALQNANNRPGSGTNYVAATEEGNWSRLGSFNVFPVSMATPRNLYQYTYTFGQIGSYSDGKLGRVMGTTKSIIKDNTRSCFYEVFEEVCLCCGYRISPGDVVEEFVNGNSTSGGSSNGYNFGLSNQGQMDNHTGTLSFYTNSVSLGDLELGRTNSANNWSEDQLFMYNGVSSLTTDKGAQLKALIEQKGETIYANKPEYSYYLTPDILKEIRNYNDAVGYELNYNNLILYGANTIACSTTSCNDLIYDNKDNPKAIFQHYGSKFLAGELKEVVKIENIGAISADNDKICIVSAGSLDSMTNMIENQKCRWIDYVQTGNSYTDPATGENPVAFRLAFK